MGLSELEKAFANKHVIVTDAFNIFTVPDKTIQYLNKYNFIIDDDDPITEQVFRKLFSDVNVTSPSHENVYVNPKTLYKDHTILITKPLSPKITLSKVENLHRHFRYPYKTLTVEDKPVVSSHPLSRKTLDELLLDQTWCYNPGEDSSVNIDILMQKLTGGPVTIDSDSFHLMKSDIEEHKMFKSFKIEIKTHNIKTCRISTSPNSPFGFQLDQWPM